MAYRLLPWVLDEERDDIKLVDKRWQPKDLLFTAQAQALLRDLVRRYDHLAAARDEMQTLDRGSLYIKYLTRMRFAVRQAHFNWKGDQLTFMRAVAAFYSDYGAVLRLLQEDSQRGLFSVGE